MGEAVVPIVSQLVEHEGQGYGYPERHVLALAERILNDDVKRDGHDEPHQQV